MTEIGLELTPWQLQQRVAAVLSTTIPLFSRTLSSPPRRSPTCHPFVAHRFATAANKHKISPLIDRDRSIADRFTLAAAATRRGRLFHHQPSVFSVTLFPPRRSPTCHPFVAHRFAIAANKLALASRIRTSPCAAPAVTCRCRLCCYPCGRPHFHPPCHLRPRPSNLPVALYSVLTVPRRCRHRCHTCCRPHRHPCCHSCPALHPPLLPSLLTLLSSLLSPSLLTNSSQHTSPSSQQSASKSGRHLSIQPVNNWLSIKPTNQPNHLPTSSPTSQLTS